MLNLIKIHATLQSANAAAEAHCTKEERKGEWGQEAETSRKKDGGFEAFCHIAQDRGEHFVIEVKKTELKVATAASTGAPKAGRAQGSVLKRKSDALKGLKVLFTGTFSIYREVCIATAEKYGATVAKDPQGTDYSFVGAQPGLKKKETIERLGINTLDERGFFELLKNGVPQAKRDRMATKAADDGPATKRQKT